MRYLLLLLIFCSAAVPPETEGKLKNVGWGRFAGLQTAIWVSIQDQKLYLIENRQITAEYPCSTAEKGFGSRENSNQTPLGWHQVDEKIGDGLPVGAIFKSRTYTGKTWQPDQPIHEEDLILSRILWLRGLEAGLNSGAGVDSRNRYIYIHGTPYENEIGKPVSHGCIRMKNKDIVSLYPQLKIGTPVLITAW